MRSKIRKAPFSCLGDAHFSLNNPDFLTVRGDGGSDTIIYRGDIMSAQRYFTREKASVEIYGRSGNSIAFVRDVSVTGACLEWAQDQIELKEGDLDRLTIILKAVNRKHNLNGEVIWKQGKRSGINFIKSEEVLERLVDRESA